MTKMVKHSSGKCYYSEKYRDQYLGWYSDTYIAALQVMTTFNGFNDQQRKAVATNFTARFKVCITSAEVQQLSANNTIYNALFCVLWKLPLIIQLLCIKMFCEPPKQLFLTSKISILDGHFMICIPQKAILKEFEVIALCCTNEQGFQNFL